MVGEQREQATGGSIAIIRIPVFHVGCIRELCVLKMIQGQTSPCSLSRAQSDKIRTSISLFSWGMGALCALEDTRPDETEMQSRTANRQDSRDLVGQSALRVDRPWNQAHIND